MLRYEIWISILTVHIEANPQNKTSSPVNLGLATISLLFAILHVSLCISEPLLQPLAPLQLCNGDCPPIALCREKTKLSCPSTRITFWLFNVFLHRWPTRSQRSWWYLRVSLPPLKCLRQPLHGGTHFIRENYVARGCLDSDWHAMMVGVYASAHT